MVDVGITGAEPGPYGRRGGIRPGAALLGLLLVAIALRWRSLNESLWFDETWRTLHRLNPEHAFDLLFRDVHNFLYNGFMYGWIRVAGESEIALRLPSLLAGLGAAWLFAGWVGRRFGVTLGWLTLCWLVFAPAHVWYSTEAKNNAFTLLFGTLALVSLDGLRTATRGAVIRAGLAIALAICTDFATLVAIVPGLVCASLGDDGRPRRARVVVAARSLGLALLLCSPLLVDRALHLDRLARSYARHFDLSEAFLLLANWFPTGNGLLPYSPYEPEAALRGARALLFVPLGALVIAMLALGVRAVHRRRSGPDRAFGGWLSFPLLLPVVGFLAMSAVLHLLWPDRGRYIYQERNLLLLMPPFAALLMAGGLTLRWRNARRAVLAVLLAVPLAATLAISTVCADQWTVYKPNPDWRGAAAWIRAHEDPDRRVVVFETSPSDGLTHYARFVRRVTVSWPPAPADVRAELDRAGADHGYVVSNRFWGGVVASDLAVDGFTFELAVQVRGVTLYRLTLSE